VEEIERSKFIEDDTKIRKIIALVSWVIVLLVPTYAVVVTNNYYGPLTETSFMWPWMVLIHLVPKEEFVSDQFVVSGFPWTFIYFLPFIYIIKLNWELYNSNKDRMKKTAFTALAAVIQIAIIAMTFESQSTASFVRETKNIYYIPQLTLLLVHLTFTVIWYFEEMQAAMQVSKLKKEIAKQKEILVDEENQVDEENKVEKENQVEKENEVDEREE
jgi:hypothetical protein